MKGLLTAIKHEKEPVYFITYEGLRRGQADANRAMFAKLGETIDFDAGRAYADELFAKKIEEEIDKNCKKISCNFGERINDDAEALVGRMRQSLEEAARLLAKKEYMSAPIVVRYHNDADGLSGAIALHRAMHGYENAIWEMHKSVAYAKSDAENDILIANAYESIEKPLLVLIDFGTSPDSNDGIEAAKERFDIIWLDHHPISQGFGWAKLDHYINPWNFGGDSNFTAGLLASVFASCFGAQTKDLVYASLIGDYSAYAKPSAQAKRVAMLLDIVSSDAKLVGSHTGNVTPEAVENIMRDESKVTEIIAYGENRLVELLDSAVSGLKVYKGKSSSIYVADFEKIRSDEERYPLPGRFASKLMEKIEESGNVKALVVLHYGSYISLRLGSGLKGINLLEVLEKVKSYYPGLVESAGGHMSAASIKLAKEGNKKPVLGKLIEELKGIA
ncbi:MAG: DHH family phosphoesterase [Candidatus Micrarchaeia archaeon]